MHCADENHTSGHEELVPQTTISTRTEVHIRMTPGEDTAEYALAFING